MKDPIQESWINDAFIQEKQDLKDKRIKNWWAAYNITWIVTQSKLTSVMVVQDIIVNGNKKKIKCYRVKIVKL